jgi:hypothetical protein
MATNTYVALDKVTIGTATTTITFTGIDQGYTDLVLIYQGATAAAANMFVRVGNGSLDTGSNYSLTEIVGSGSSASSSRLTSQAEIKITEGLFVNTNEQCNIIMNFQNYSNATTYKTLLSRANSAAIGVQAQVSLWRSTSAINTISVYASQNFNTGTTISLYGIAAEGTTPAAKATGGAIYSDADYYYHVFGSTGVFTPTQSITADYLVVAGGGGGGGNASGGGGGAGGVRAFASQSLTAQAYTVTVGAGGAGGSGGVAHGVAGNTTTINSNSVSGGGRGSGSNGTSSTGGSGGGGSGDGSNNSGAAGNSGSYSPVEGFLGTNSGGANTGGGGGGSGGAAGAASSTVGGAGGIGSDTYNSINFSTWLSATSIGVSGKVGGGGGGSSRAGGGAGGTAVNGGGAGALSASGSAATANTGGGGGGGGTGSGGSGGAGGSGIVIVRYAKV